VSRLLVTGGSGYLGREVVAQATAAGRQVTFTTFGSQAPGGWRVDLADAAAVEALVDEVAPDAVVHTAYDKDGPRAWPVIVEGSEALARAAARQGARLVHVSSDVVFAGDAGRPYTEQDAPDATGGYGGAKAEAERRIRAALPDAVLVRTSLIVGGLGHPPGPHERAALDPHGVFWTDVLRNPVQVADLAAALLELVEVPVTGPLHVAGVDAVSRWQLAALVAGRDVAAAAAPPGTPLDCRLDSTRAQGLLRTRLRGAREVFGGPTTG
jgi:dTDP-4-dehydrorhamnose reductase